VQAGRASVSRTLKCSVTLRSLAARGGLQCWICGFHSSDNGEYSLMGYNACVVWFCFLPARSGFLFLPFDHEDGGDMFLRNVGLSRNYTLVQPRNSVLEANGIFTSLNLYFVGNLLPVYLGRNWIFECCGCGLRLFRD
jgi:hypothetical protein